MSINLDVLEKFGWTAFDFLVQRPRRFFELRVKEPNRYMDPIPFAVTNFIITEAVLVGSIQLLSPIVDWKIVTGLKFQLPTGVSLPTVIAITGAVQLFFLLLNLIFFKLAAGIVWRRIESRELVISLCYSYSTSLIFIMYWGLSVFVLLVVSSTGSNVNSLAKVFYQGASFLGIILLPYFVGSAAAFGKISFRRLLIGYVITNIILFHNNNHRNCFHINTHLRCRDYSLTRSLQPTSQ
jgi:hypothetical protein